MFWPDFAVTAMPAAKGEQEMSFVMTREERESFLAGWAAAR
jgi:hypothetical protein